MYTYPTLDPRSLGSENGAGDVHLAQGLAHFSRVEHARTVRINLGEEALPSLVPCSHAIRNILATHWQHIGNTLTTR